MIRHIVEDLGVVSLTLVVMTIAVWSVALSIAP